MRSLLCIIWLSSCFVTISVSSPAGISPPTSLHRGDINDLGAMFNLTGFLTLQPSKNITRSSPVRFHISGFIDLTIPHNETIPTRNLIADWDDALIEERQPVFRKDYTLDEVKEGWYKLHRVPATWKDARERCELEGAELASPLNAKIHKAMVSQMQGLNRVFTGVHSLFSYGDYYSIKGISLEEMPVNWSVAISADKDKRCVELLFDGTINNINCDTVSLPYICYKDNNYRTLTECGTFDTEYTLNSQLNTCYKLHTNIKTWNDAFKTCSAEGGHLVVVNSNQELTAVVQLFNKDTLNGRDLEYKVHTGVTKWSVDEPWITIEGEYIENSGFSTWALNNPNTGDGYGVPPCAAIKLSGLISLHCGTGLPFVCEKKPNSLVSMEQLYEVMKPIDI